MGEQVHRAHSAAALIAKVLFTRAILARTRLHVFMYVGTLVYMTEDPRLEIERVQTGVRMEKRILKVLKAFAEYHDMTLGDVLEGIVLHAFDGKTPFSPASLEKIRELKKFYELDLDSSASHRLKEIKARSGRKRKEGA